MENYEKKVDENLIEMKRKDENNMTKNVIISLIFSVTLLIGMIVCAICDIAIFGKLTWSLIPISSIIFAWVELFPIIILGKKGITGSLISISIFVIPYLYVLSDLVKVKTVFSIGAVMAIIAIAYMWLIFMLYNKLRERKLIWGGIIALISVVFMGIINIVLSKMISEPVMDMWDTMTAFLLTILAFILFVFDYAKNKGLVK